MELTKNKSRGERRKRNMVAKALRTHSGGPIPSKKEKIITEIDQKEMDLPLTGGLFEEQD